MSHISDFTLSDKEILTALVLYDNPTLTLTPSLVDYVNPYPIQGERNTNLTVAPRPESEYSGVVDVTYQRLNIQDFVDILTDGGLEIVIDSTETLLDLIPDINAALGINLTEADYENIVLPPFENIPNATLQVNIPMRPTSLIYIGELSFLVRRSAISLTEVVSVTYLTGLNYPEGDEFNEG